ncbi:hypothetical protein ACCO45_003820 [Purpureocillium lilacinum]|uniref:Uncharacterized protein n=1 Tax=Purpureocillium lilacinum TaxID=33203 RepID=A0ACC4E285_PURLI
MEVDTIDEPVTQVRDNGALAVKKTRMEFVSPEEKARRRRLQEAHKAYGRGKKIDTKHIKDKKLRRNLKHLENKYQHATIKAKDAEILLENTSGFLEPEAELERTYKVRQDDITSGVAVETAQKRFDLKLDQLGPYTCEYSRNGRELLLAGRRGHVATMDWREGKLGCELQLGETIRDYVYIYDRDGVELHCLRKHTEVTHMEFLPYHFLLATIGTVGVLKYQDTSTGQLVAEMPTKLGQPVSMTQNPYNAVLHVGHQSGAVTLWSPNSQEPLVKLLAHRGLVRSLSVDREGRYMVSTGQDLKMAVWDIRMFREEQVQSPYMAWGGEGKRIERVRWCPYEDILGVSHDQGFSSLIVPGAGEANFDALEVNPFETAKQRQESEVKGLLNKLQPDMIALDPNFIGNLDLRSNAQKKAEKDLDTPAADIAEEIRNRARGKNGALKKYLRKQRKKNIIDEKRLRVDELWKEQQQKNDKKRKEVEADLGPALSRFARREH